MEFILDGALNNEVNARELGGRKRLAVKRLDVVEKSEASCGCF